MNRFLFLVILICMFIFGSVAMAQRSASTEASGREGANETSVNVPSSFQIPEWVMSGIKSYNDSGRPDQLSAPQQLEVKSKNEMFFGAKNKYGYGVYAQAVEYLKEYNPTATGIDNKSGINSGDPSLSFVHPLYTSDRVILSGLFRQYFPVSFRSVNQTIYQEAYYLNYLNKLHGGFDLFNQLVPRYFYNQKFYKGNDGVFYTEDWTTISRNVKPWMRLGFGQHYQVETHLSVPTGQTMEVFPYADFMLSKSVFAGPRLYFPVAVQNYVFDAPHAVAFDEVQAELYLQATL